jgi:hypothetical protein
VPQWPRPVSPVGPSRHSSLPRRYDRFWGKRRHRSTLAVAYLFWSAEEWRKHFLEAGDQVVGFPIALQQGFDGLVLDADLSFEKFVFAFEVTNVIWRDRTQGQFKSAFGPELPLSPSGPKLYRERLPRSHAAGSARSATSRSPRQPRSAALSRAAMTASNFPHSSTGMRLKPPKRATSS